MDREAETEVEEGKEERKGDDGYVFTIQRAAATGSEPGWSGARTLGLSPMGCRSPRL